jgi:CRP-like cAMP-binding protein
VNDLSASPTDPARLAALGRSPLLAGLPGEDLSRLLAATEPVEVPAGETVVREGDASGDMYFVLGGEARQRRHDLALKPLGPGGR